MGLEKLAYMLENEPKLKNIQKISGLSWIGAVHPKIIENLGFSTLMDKSEYIDLRNKYDLLKPDIPEKYREIEPVYSYISREDFIHRYGIKKEGTKEDRLVA